MRTARRPLVLTSMTRPGGRPAYFDVDRAEQAVLALGARRLPAEREEGFRVFADPAGHPFCLVFG
jgi:hypothetical protein